MHATKGDRRKGFRLQTYLKFSKNEILDLKENSIRTICNNNTEINFNLFPEIVRDDIKFFYQSIYAKNYAQIQENHKPILNGWEIANATVT